MGGTRCASAVSIPLKMRRACMRGPLMPTSGGGSDRATEQAELEATQHEQNRVRLQPSFDKYDLRGGDVVAAMGMIL